MKRDSKALILFVLIVLQAGCEKDILENFRKEYTGSFDFTTIREDVTTIPVEIIDTLYYSGSISAIYSNRTDLIEIRFAPESSLNAVVNSSGALILPPVPVIGSIRTLNGFFTDGNSRITFNYKISSGSTYSVNHKVEGIRP